MKPIPPLTEDEMATIRELQAIMGTIGAAFVNQDGDPELLRVAATLCEESGDLFRGLADRWEADDV